MDKKKMLSYERYMLHKTYYLKSVVKVAVQIIYSSLRPIKKNNTCGNKHSIVSTSTRIGMQKTE